ncbi:MAG: SoxR reducing system RseC family protein [Nitrospirota bacterium]
MVKCKSVEEVGLVKSAEGMVAKVLVERKNACEGCTSGMCKPADQSMEIEALNPLNAHAGQKVRVEIRPYSHMRGSLIVYGIPVLSLVAGAVLGREVFSLFLKNLDSDSVSALFGFGAFGISLLFIKVWSTRLTEKKPGMKPMIKEIIE